MNNNIKVTVGASAIRDHWIVKSKPVCRSTAHVVAQTDLALKPASLAITCKKCSAALRRIHGIPAAPLEKRTGE